MVDQDQRVEAVAVPLEDVVMAAHVLNRAAEGEVPPSVQRRARVGDLADRLEGYAEGRDGPG